MAFLGPSLRRNKVVDRPVRRVVLAVLVSLAANAGILLILAVLGAFEVPKSLDAEKVELAELSAKDWEQNRAIVGMPTPEPEPPPRPAQAPPKVEPPVPPEKPKEDRGQVVDVAPSKESRPPADARFRSEHDNSVEKETRSRFQGSGNWRNRAPLPMAGQEGRKKGGAGGADDEQKVAKQGQGGTNGKGGKSKPAAQEARPAPPEGDRLALLERPKLPPTGPEQPRSREEGEGIAIPGPPGEAQEGKQRSGDARLMPSLDDLSRIAAGPSNDALPADIEEGEVTALNTRAYRFATFWNRFKQDVADHWFPGVRYEMERDPDGTTFGRSDRVTGLRITLDAAGAVKKIEVTAPSGLDFLDKVAVKSVRDASPFYNVPRGLLDAKGELSFEFGFLVGGSRGIPVRPRWQPP